MKKLSEYIGKKVAVNCTTIEQAEAFCKLMHENRLKWGIGISYLNTTNWDVCKEYTCYTLDSYGYATKDFFISEGYEILPATDFLEEEFVYGQEYEFSDDEDFTGMIVKGRFVGKTTNGLFIAERGKDCYIGSFKYCRKINTERNEAITTAKQLITKFNIKQEEIY